MSCGLRRERLVWTAPGCVLSCPARWAVRRWRRGRSGRVEGVGSWRWGMQHAQDHTPVTEILQPSPSW